MKERFGGRIRRLRTEQKLGLRKFATKVGISPTYLSRIETSKERAPPAEEVIRKMAGGAAAPAPASPPPPPPPAAPRPTGAIPDPATARAQRVRAVEWLRVNEPSTWQRLDTMRADELARTLEDAITRMQAAPQ